VRATFVRPCIPADASRPPPGEGWLHEPKFDGYRFQVLKHGDQVRLYSKSGAEYTERLPQMVEAFQDLPAATAVLDGELCFVGADGQSNFHRLHAEMRTRWPDEAQLMFIVFDLLHQDGVDLRPLPLSERKRDLDRLCRQSKVAFMTKVQAFPDGPVLLDCCAKFGFEGVVSKRLDRPYVGGPSKAWVKIKCPDWKRDNSERFRMFEGRYGR
jgi:bifunctional non-homologous end joining protein LigD